MTAEIPLTRGLVALVDATDYEALAAHKWHAIHPNPGRFYAARSVVVNGRKRMIYMHREILGFPSCSDHVNGCTLDNRRANLRACTTQENVRNSKDKGPQSGFKGVARGHNKTRWDARITISHRPVYLGSFGSKEEAARAYDAAASKLFGAFARPNFPASKLGAAEAKPQPKRKAKESE